MKDSYKILGINENATMAEVQAAYMKLKAEYSEKRYRIGKEGQDAACMLDEIETAYNDILKNHSFNNGEDEHYNANTCHASSISAQFNDKYDEIEDLLRNEKIDKAQKILDDMPGRTAEWHYLQSIIYYKKNWYLESKKQLQFAINLDPNNMKYKNAMDKLLKIMSSKTTNPENYSAQNSDYSHQPGHKTSTDAGVPTCTGSCCGDVCLANLCCNCGQMCCLH